MKNYREAFDALCDFLIAYDRALKNADIHSEIMNSIISNMESIKQELV